MTEDLAQALRADFADSTGLSEKTPPRRYGNHQGTPTIEIRRR